MDYASNFRRLLMVGASAGTMLISTTAFAQSAGSPQEEASRSPNQTSDIVVTGTRIIREGYQAPTPLTVLGADALQAAATGNAADTLNTLPIFSGSRSPVATVGGVVSGEIGLNQMNLRSLGRPRTLVLLDGQRAGNTIGTGVVDVNSFPMQLIKRVDIVTGGASAVYGSDAVTGVVNFILDRDYTGIKGEISAGQTNYKDDGTFSANLTGGFSFDDGRGHLLLSGEYFHKNGVVSGAPRPWNQTGVAILRNPNYTPTNGQPFQLLLPRVTSSNLTRGGIITSGPLRGTAFGPGGSVYQFPFGSLTADPNTYDSPIWKDNDVISEQHSLDPREERINLFGRASYDITDNVNAFAQFSWVRTDATAQCCSSGQFLGFVTAAIPISNQFIPQSVRDAMVANGLSTISVGSYAYDLGKLTNNTVRNNYRGVVGLEGKFKIGEGDWNWNTYFQSAISKSRSNSYNNPNVFNWLVALGANPFLPPCSVVAGCSPYNPFGEGVNSTATVDFINGESIANQKVTQNVWSATLSGSPFSNWAGPISTSFNFEHRTEKAVGSTDAVSAAGGYSANNIALNGKYNVTEGALEVVVPLAKDLSWANNWDVSGAIRRTDYSTSGAVTTWKLGTTYSPIPDIKFRVTRSRDIRAGSLFELFAPGQVRFVPLGGTDPFCAPGPQQLTPIPNCQPNPSVQTFGNPDLKPEVADTLGVGVVLQPSFLPGFSASVDYWKIDIKNTIIQLQGAQILNFCFEGNQAFCDQIVRDRNTNTVTGINARYENIASQNAEGIDFEASYTFPIGRGALNLHGNATYYIKNVATQGPGASPIDYVGGLDSVANGGEGVPEWRYSVTATLKQDPFTISLTGRGMSGGRYNNSWIECSTNCPASTGQNLTINNNRIDGAFYLDTAMSYEFNVGKTSAELFFNIRNLLDKDPPQVASSNIYNNLLANVYLHDILGRVYRAGIRFKM